MHSAQLHPTDPIPLRNPGKMNRAIHARFGKPDIHAAEKDRE